MNKTVKTLAKIALWAALAGSGASFAQTLEIAGSTTVQKSIVDSTQARIKGATGIDVKMLGVGTGKGLQMLFDGKVKVAAVSDTLEDAVAGAKKVGAPNTQVEGTSRRSGRFHRHDGPEVRLAAH